MELKAQPSHFTKPASQNKAATDVSFRLAKHREPFTDGDLLKETMAITSETVGGNIKNLKAAIHAVPLCPATVTRRVELLSEEVDQQVLKDLSLNIFCYRSMKHWMLWTQPAR